MKLETSFFMAMIPPTATHQEKKVRVLKRKNRSVLVFYEPQALKDARAKLKVNLAKHVLPKPLDGPIQVLVKWIFPITGTGKNKRKDGQWKDTKPDAHNLQKLLFDLMTDLGFWKDDARVCSETIEKFWGEKPGIFISIRSL